MKGRVFSSHDFHHTLNQMRNLSFQLHCYNPILLITVVGELSHSFPGCLPGQYVFGFVCSEKKSGTVTKQF